jgi:hypothetical protein
MEGWKTDMYKLEWKTANQAGYISAWVKKGNNELLLFEGAATGRRFYHSDWKDGRLEGWKIPLTFHPSTLLVLF